MRRGDSRLAMRSLGWRMAVGEVSTISNHIEADTGNVQGGDYNVRD